MQLVAALVTGLFGLVSAVIGVYFNTWIDNRDFIRDRVGALKGSWSGTIDQEIGPTGNPLSYGVHCRIASAGRRVTGMLRSAAIPGIIEHEREFSISGGFMNNRYLRFEYKDVNPEAVQF